jgi:hypothetical protein
VPPYYFLPNPIINNVKVNKMSAIYNLNMSAALLTTSAINMTAIQTSKIVANIEAYFI